MAHRKANVSIVGSVEPMNGMPLSEFYIAFALQVGVTAIERALREAGYTNSDFGITITYPKADDAGVPQVSQASTD